MKKKEQDKIQFLINILPSWKKALERIARNRSVQEDKTITMTDIIREAVWNIISGSVKND